MVNRVLADMAEGAFMRARLEQQFEYLKEIMEHFQKQDIIHVEQDARDITRREQLTAIAKQLGGVSV